MKSFYFTSIVIVLALAAAPFVFLPRAGLDRFKGKVVLYNVYGAKVKSIDPATSGDTTSASMQGNVFEGLYTYHYLKRPVEVVCQLAEALPKVSPDGLTYTIRIKEGVKFARNPCFGVDEAGQPKTRFLRAEDFITSFKRIADYHLTTSLSLAFVEDKISGLAEYRDRTQNYKKGDFSRYTKESISGLRALDDHTLEITLTKPFPQFLYVLAMPVYAPVPSEVIDYHLATKKGPQDGRVAIDMDQRDPEIRDVAAMVGTGAYVMTEWVKAGKIVFERNPDYRDEFYPTEGAPGDAEAGLLEDAGKKLPLVDVRYLTFVAEENPAWMLFLSRQRDTGGIPRDVFSSVITPSRELTESLGEKGIRLLKTTYPAIYWLAFNMEDSVLGNSRSLRQAMCLAFDVETYIETIHNGRGVRAVNTIPRDFKGHIEAGPSPYAVFDRGAAKRKIQAARAELAEAGVIEPGAEIPELTLDMPGTGEYYRRVSEFCKGQFAQVGLRLKIEMNDWPTLQEKVHNKLTQIYAMGWHADYPDGENFLQLYYSPNIKRGTNNTNYSNPDFDKLFEQAAVMQAESQRIPLYAKMTRILNEDCPVLMLSEPISFGLLYDWVGNYKPHPIAYGLGKYTRIDVNLRRKLGGRR